MKVLIGYDYREEQACEVAARTLKKVSGIDAEFLRHDKLSAHGLLWRTTDKRGGQDYDLVSNAKKSTQFAASRFLTPLISDGWCLFTDGDVVFREDPRHMLKEVCGKKAVYVVKHDYTSGALYKMVNQQNVMYPRKNWSSVMLFNSSHPANRRLSLRDVNERPGRDLHQFYWLNDDEIGSLDPRWNWLVNEQEQPPFPDGIAHFTLGGPWLAGWQPTFNDNIWLDAAAESSCVTQQFVPGLRDASEG